MKVRHLIRDLKTFDPDEDVGIALSGNLAGEIQGVVRCVKPRDKPDLSADKGVAQYAPEVTVIITD